MEEEGGEEDTEHVDRESVGKDDFIEGPLSKNSSVKVPPDHPGHITDSGDGNVDISESPTENDTKVFTSPVDVQSRESEVSCSGEDYEGGLSVEDLQRGNISEVQSGEEGK